MFKWLLLCLSLILFPISIKSVFAQEVQKPKYSVVVEKSVNHSYTAHIELQEQIKDPIYLMIRLDNRSPKKISIENSDYEFSQIITFYNTNRFYYNLYNVPKKFIVNINSEKELESPVEIKLISQKNYIKAMVSAEMSSGGVQSMYIGALAISIILLFFRKNMTSVLFTVYSIATFMYVLATRDNFFEFLWKREYYPSLNVVFGMIAFNSRIIYEYFLFRSLKYAKLYLYLSSLTLILSVIILALNFFGMEYLALFNHGFSYVGMLLLLIAVILLKNNDKIIILLVFVEATNVSFDLLFSIFQYFGFYTNNLFAKFELVADFVDSFGLLALNLILFSRERVRAIIDNAQHEREKLELKNSSLLMEIKILNFQMNPHFFFNSLNCLRSLMSFDIINAIIMLDKLVSLYHLITLNSKKDSVTLAEEMELIKYYLEIEKIRFEERIQYEEPNYDDFKSVLIPNFSIFTLVENAVKHGISKSISGGKISIIIKRTVLSIYITVRNEALGEQEDTFPINPEVTLSTLTGLSNLKKRLLLMYGDQSELNLYPSPDNSSFEASFSIPHPN